MHVSLEIKIPGIQAALCHDIYSAHQCVEHDDVNILCLGAQIVGDKVTEDILKPFLAAKFSTEEHFRRRVIESSEVERRAAEDILQASAYDSGKVTYNAQSRRQGLNLIGYGFSAS